ncbi:alpha-1,3-mannosyl-glycoprotein 4-beta-N-acetylglucosaminyltransferase A-like [Styela clava]|uniref:alpha-1,3-mannosyl-glycoprotein 4-beta-N-acetylglucosaminyltransferase A-like n=1 Tax=Styela clava TaxID=7725 RepID=UPI00193AA27B|nr:alpha-1,3-mannosyl-glycoprotein 4-beta-N-acetylglucosaminyltransferase A-like [Styela clava]
MFGRHFTKFLIFAIVFNVFLLAVFSTLNSISVFKRTTSILKPGVSEQILVVELNRTEPYIVPKLHQNPQAALLETEPAIEFKRIKWPGPFEFKGEEIISQSLKLATQNNSTNVTEYVIGITTITRPGVSYLHNTLRSLINGLGDFRNVTIAVYIGEEEPEDVKLIESGLQGDFASEISSGLIKVISPPENFYPDWNEELRQSFGDSFQRVKWRSKQNLDQIFLMTYTYYLNPKYYIMLEDDVLASNDYLSKINADAEARADENYVMISYCQLGAIGKLLRREILPSMSTYFRLFWADKPLDWLMLDYMKSRVCNDSKGDKDCAEKLKEIEIVYKPSLFQHVGLTSSLEGKIQKLKDKNFKP